VLRSVDQTPTAIIIEAGDEKETSVADSNMELPASAATLTTAQTPAATKTKATSVAEAALRQFPPQLTAKILDLLCDESVSRFWPVISGTRNSATAD